MEKYVRVMADHMSSGLWGNQGMMLEPGVVTLTPQLEVRLAAWVSNYNKNCKDYLSNAVDSDEFDWDKHSADGLAIAKAIKAELPDWKVVYFDEAKLTYENQDRREFEYEIHADK